MCDVESCDGVEHRHDMCDRRSRVEQDGKEDKGFDT